MLIKVKDDNQQVVTSIIGELENVLDMGTVQIKNQVEET
jgi:hypothetical protein